MTMAICPWPPSALLYVHLGQKALLPGLGDKGPTSGALGSSGSPLQSVPAVPSLLQPWCWLSRCWEEGHPRLATVLPPTLPSWLQMPAKRPSDLERELCKPPWAGCSFVPEIQATRQGSLLPPALKPAARSPSPRRLRSRVLGESRMQILRAKPCNECLSPANWVRRGISWTSKVKQGKRVVSPALLFL